MPFEKYDYCLMPIYYLNIETNCFREWSNINVRRINAFLFFYALG